MMRLNELVKNIRNAIKQIKVEEKKTASQDQLEEDQLTMQDIESLLAFYEHNDTLIDNEALLDGFFNFLAYRYQRVALTSASYQASPHSYANQLCHTIANQLILAANQVRYKPRHLNDILTPPLVWSMGSLAQVFLEQINKQLEHPEWHDAIFTTLESYRALIILHTVLSHFNKDQRPVQPDTIKPILELFKLRWSYIEDTAADYIYNPTTLANQLYHELAKSIFLILQAGGYDVHALSADRLLRPTLNHTSAKGEEAIEQHVLAVLSNEAQSASVNKPLLSLLKKMAIRECDVAAFIKAQIKSALLQSDELHSVPVMIESREALAALTSLCDEDLNSHAPVSRRILSRYMDFLNDRWKRINGTPASYQAETETNANQVCITLSHLLSVLAYHQDHLNRQASKILMRTPPQAFSKEVASERLRQAVSAPVKNREFFLANLSHLDGKKWPAYLSCFDHSQLIMLLSCGNTAYASELLDNQNMYGIPSGQAKAYLYAMFEVYARHRQDTKAAHTSYLGAISSFVLYVPDREAKVQAVMALQQLLASERSLTEIAGIVTDEKSDFYKQHGHVIAGGILNRYVALIVKMQTSLEQEMTNNKEPVVLIKMY